MTEAVTAGGAFRGRPTGRFLVPIIIVLERAGHFAGVPVAVSRLK